MANLKPIGSEKLTGQDKLNRIMEIARFNETAPKTINKNATSEYSISLADGNNYQIVRERQGYIIKKTISESETDYIEPMKNRKYYSSYSQAFKRLNLVAGELNRLNENEEGLSLYGEQKKFVLKTPKAEAPAPAPAPAPMAPPAEPPSVPSPELPPSPMGGEDMGMDDMGMDDMGPEGDVEDVDVDIDVNDDDNEGHVTFKSIQKLTGKLTQKIRTLDSEEGMTSEDIKYVINMVIASLDLKSLSEEDKEDIMSKFEEDSEDMGDDDMGMDDMGDDDMGIDDMGMDDMCDEEMPVEGEMEEGMYGSFGNMRRDDYKGDKYYDEKDRSVKDSDLYGMAGDDFDTEEFDTFQKLYDKYGDKQSWFNKTDGESMFNKYKEMTGRPFKVKTRKGENGAIYDSVFGESKVDKVISKYFEVSKSEIREQKEKQVQQILKKKSDVKKIMESVVKMTETIEQELAAKRYLQENLNSKFVGITNKKNLVFENKGGQVRITPNGDLI